MNAKALRKTCFDCPDSKQHQTGSQIWLSCKHQSGWRDVNSKCNLEVFTE